MKYVYSVIIFIVSLVLFMILEYGRVINSAIEIIQPITFAAVLAVIFLNSKIRLPILWFSLILLFLMVIFYLFSILSVANLIGSLGIGILTLVIFSYFPKLIKDGHI